MCSTILTLSLYYEYIVIYNDKQSHKLGFSALSFSPAQIVYRLSLANLRGYFRHEVRILPEGSVERKGS